MLRCATDSCYDGCWNMQSIINPRQERTERERERGTKGASHKQNRFTDVSVNMRHASWLPHKMCTRFRNARTCTVQCPGTSALSAPHKSLLFVCACVLVSRAAHHDATTATPGIVERSPSAT